MQVLTPVLSPPTHLSHLKSQMGRQKNAPLVPGIVYPFELTRYENPADLASYVFWHAYRHSHKAPLLLDCAEAGLCSGQDLLYLTTAQDAATYLTERVTGREPRQADSSSDSDSDTADESDTERDLGLPIVTISVSQLCKKLKKMNHHFSYEIANSRDEYLEAHKTDELSSKRRQTQFIEAVMSEIFEWQN